MADWSKEQAWAEWSLNQASVVPDLKDRIKRLRRRIQQEIQKLDFRIETNGAEYWKDLVEVKYTFMLGHGQCSDLERYGFLHEVSTDLRTLKLFMVDSPQLEKVNALIDEHDKVYARMIELSRWPDFRTDEQKIDDRISKVRNKLLTKYHFLGG